jgi:hypothetical protein
MKLNETKVRAIRQTWAKADHSSPADDTALRAKLAHNNDISVQALRDIVEGISWKHVATWPTEEKVEPVEVAVHKNLVRALREYEDTMHPEPYADQAYSNEMPRIKSSISGKLILPDTPNAAFCTIWFALLEYKSTLETDILKMTMPGSIHHEVGLEDWQKIYVNNSPMNLEDQTYLYEGIARITKLLNEYTERAQKLGLI